MKVSDEIFKLDQKEKKIEKKTDGAFKLGQKEKNKK